MSAPPLRRSECSSAATQERVHYVKAQRQHLVRETRMLQLALEELQEEAEQGNGEEALVRREVDSTQRELLRCLLHLALAKHDLDRDTVLAADAQAPQELTSALICEVLQRYKHEQDTFTQEFKQRLERSREEARQACLNVGDMFAAPRREHDESGDVGLIVDTTELDSLRSDLETLRQMRAEVEEETEATLLNIGCTLFC
ncbi:hypothetical protein, conserved [Leishmania tarentolae]|uniref:Uncharacterized protein n=1 Tax=Leishmania tarentolae TaxID=5689 RepID=A0A640KW08_LEITA|nr:hypothetical protein, conserved [Leishmania tarentolae]